MQTFDALRLENQLCFPLYACAKEVVRKYKPFLDPLGLTYTQYIAMMVLWAEPTMTVKALGDRLFLDSGTLTPMLKKMEGAGFISRMRDPADERSVLITVTAAGQQLKEAASKVPAQMGGCINLSPEESMTLYTLLYKLLHQLEDGCPAATQKEQ